MDNEWVFWKDKKKKTRGNKINKRNQCKMTYRCVKSKVEDHRMRPRKLERDRIEVK